VQVNNLKLSPEEVAAISEVKFYLLKNSATKKIVGLFGVLEAELKSDVVSNIEKYSISEIINLNTSSGKIFRGENYRLFPYIILDYPRLFSTKSVFAFRTMFWWGHEFSFTLHMQGDALEVNRKKIYENINSLKGKDVFYCVNSTPWQYNFDAENYLPIDENTERKEEILSKPFIKLSRRLPVEGYEDVHDYCKETLRLFMGLLK
jgi:hypothetical protein